MFFDTGMTENSFLEFEPTEFTNFTTTGGAIHEFRGVEFVFTFITNGYSGHFIEGN